MMNSIWEIQIKLHFTLDRVSFRRHIRRHYKTKEFACEWCEKQFAELCALRRHERVHTGELKETPYECNLCDKRYCYEFISWTACKFYRKTLGISTYNLFFIYTYERV